MACNFGKLKKSIRLHFGGCFPSDVHSWAAKCKVGAGIFGFSLRGLSSLTESFTKYAAFPVHM